VLNLSAAVLGSKASASFCAEFTQKIKPVTWSSGSSRGAVRTVRREMLNLIQRQLLSTQSSLKFHGTIDGLQPRQCRSRSVMNANLQLTKLGITMPPSPSFSPPVMRQGACQRVRIFPPKWLGMAGGEKRGWLSRHVLRMRCKAKQS